MENNLNKWFEAAKASDPILTANEVEAMISNPPAVKGGFSTLKRSVFMTSLFVLIFGIWFWGGEKPSSTIVLQQEGIQQAASVPQIKANDSSKPLPNQNQKVFILHQGKKEEVRNDKSPKDTIMTAPFITGGYANASIQSFESESQDMASNIQLSYEELADLGIITDGNTLTYETITDSVVKIEDEGKKYAPSFKISIEKHGSSSTVIAYDKDGKISKQSKLFWPAFIQMMTDKDTTLHLVEYLLNSDREYSHFFEETKEILIPVEVNLKAKPGRWSNDLTLIFWFKPETTFLAALPSSIQQTLRSKESLIDEYCKILKDYRLNHNNQSVNNLSDSMRVSQQLKRARSYTDDQLYDIFGIQLTKNGFVYSNTIKLGRSKIKVKIRQMDFSTFTDINKTYFGKVGPKNYTACAMTRSDMDYIEYLYVYPDSVSRSQQERENVIRFRQDLEKLVPVVFEGFVLWFPPHPELLRKLEDLKP
jgi:hypothetical protein